ncbi:MAG: N-acetylmuramoyl-L-alanine amidase, partial [Myxococcales bacterium]
MWLALDDAEPVAPADVVLDPGHGGDELGALGRAGLEEKAVNLEVARLAAEKLRASGVRTELTRGSDFRATLAFRVALARALAPRLLVSIHHNAEPDGPLDRPGSETYYQHGSGDSKRLAGLVYEEMVRALRAFEAGWVGDHDAGAKYRLNGAGADYYGILRHAAAARIPATLA